MPPRSKRRLPGIGFVARCFRRRQSTDLQKPRHTSSWDINNYAKQLLYSPPLKEPPIISRAIAVLKLQKHIEGGYFVETDRSSQLVPNPFQHLQKESNATAVATASGGADNSTRSASTSIHYLLGRKSPVGHFHRNRGRTIHTLHRGRGIYVIIHADQPDENGICPIDTFVVGHDLAKGERLQWIVEGGKFKASFLLPDAGEKQSKGGLLISETVVPGFEYSDHDFMTAEGFKKLVDDAVQPELRWLLKADEQKRL